MKDIIIIICFIIGVILLNIAKKTQMEKYLKCLGTLIIIVCLCMAIPDFIKGFIDGLVNSPRVQ